MPERLHAATEDPRPRPHQIHAVDGSRIRHPRVCEAGSREVPEGEIARGWEAPDGRMVVLRNEDLDHLTLPARKTIEIVRVRRRGRRRQADVRPRLLRGPHRPGRPCDEAKAVGLGYSLPESP
jgi:hypothetical protein